MTPIDQPPLPYRMDAYPIEREVITSQPNFRGAMDLSLTLCGFDSDKDAARALKIDPGLFSRRRTGQAAWQVDDVARVMERGQNLIPLAWLASRYGHGLVMLETEAERRERAARETMQRQAEQIAYLERLVQGKAL